MATFLRVADLTFHIATAATNPATYQDIAMTPFNETDRASTRADPDTRADWLRYRRAACILPTDETHLDFQDAMTLPWKKDDTDESHI